MPINFFRKFMRKAPAITPASNERADFAELNSLAPLRQAHNTTQSIPDATPPLTTILCRETVLGRDQRIAGYLFALCETQHQRLSLKSRRVAHLCAEVLVNSLIAADIGRLLGHRLLFIEVPDSFLPSPELAKLPRQGTVLLPYVHVDAGGPDLSETMANIRQLQSLGMQIGFPDPLSVTEFAPFMDVADVFWIKSRGINVEHDRRMRQLLQTRSSRPPALLVRNLDSLEHFEYCFKTGVSYFQGTFITSREPWSQDTLNPDFTRISQIITQLQADAGTEQIAAPIKQDAALSMRLLRYINSAAVALPERVSSIERALVLTGRSKLYRWLILLAYGADGLQGRASAALEIALVRARMMELLGKVRTQGERDTLFLVGLLSLADVILSMPLDKALAPIAVTGEVAASLQGDGPWRPFLDLAIACEQSSPDDIAALATACATSVEHASACHLDAMNWAMALQA